MKETKAEIVNEIKTITTIYCDDCNQEIIKEPYSGRSYKCTICGKDLCDHCTKHYDDSEDFPDQYCNNCWNVIGSRYRAEIDRLEEEIDRLHHEWYDKCIIK